MAYNISHIVEKLKGFKIVPVITLDNSVDVLPLADTLIQQNLPVLEITFRSSAAEKAIYLLKKHNPEVLILAGTVLTVAEVLKAKNAGADVVVTPGLNPKIVQLCQDLDLPIIPGVNNPMSIEAALESNISTVKFFPAEASGGVQMIKSLIAPYSQLQIMPTGGISTNNIKDYLAIANVIACGGSWFVDKSLIKAQNWGEIERLVRDVNLLIK